MNKIVDLIVDLQYGSTGKGKVAGYMARRNGYDVVVNANMPNAGHTFIDKDGVKYVHKVLPNGIVSPQLKYCLLGAGSVFSLAQLQREISFAAENGIDLVDKLKIHENAVVLTDEHKKAEKEFSRIGSTQQGSAGALMEKMKRDPQSKVIARDVLSGSGLYEEKFLISNSKYVDIIVNANRVLAEGAQGYSLGISQSFYPYCTSRDCTPGRLLADMNIPIQLLNNVIGVLRPYPIRVGGTSGGCYSDQKEIKWKDIGVDPEVTTVTGRERRVFSFSLNQYKDAIKECMPNDIVLNFTDYLSIEELNDLKRKCTQSGLSDGIKWHYGTGAGEYDIIIDNDNYL
jgi:adenylosuccinate synthase